MAAYFLHPFFLIVFFASTNAFLSRFNDLSSAYCMKHAVFSSRSSSSSRDGASRGKDSRSRPEDKIKLAKTVRVLRDELSDIICSCDIKANVYPDEEMLKTVSIVDIDLSPDFSTAKVFISVLGNSVEKRQIYVWLSENIGQVRHSLSKRLKSLRKVPQVTFSLSDTKAAFYLNDLIDELATKGQTDNFDDIDFEEDV